MSTPGPWHANLKSTRISVSARSASVAHMIYCDDAARADAVLIASAPEMLSALWTAFEFIGSGESAGRDKVLEQISFAINAAEGR